MGSTVPVEGASASPLNRLESGQCDGYIVDRTCMGTYIHGILDNDDLRRHLLNCLRKHKGLEPLPKMFDYLGHKEAAYNRLADIVEANLDMDYIDSLLAQQD